MVAASARVGVERSPQLSLGRPQRWQPSEPRPPNNFNLPVRHDVRLNQVEAEFGMRNKTNPARSASSSPSQRLCKRARQKPNSVQLSVFRKWGCDIIPHRVVLKNGFETPDGKRASADDAFKDPNHPSRVAICLHHVAHEIRCRMPPDPLHLQAHEGLHPHAGDRSCQPRLSRQNRGRATASVTH